MRLPPCMSIISRRSITSTKTKGAEKIMEKYEDLEMEVIAFDTEDVITDSIELPEEEIDG